MRVHWIFLILILAIGSVVVLEHNLLGESPTAINPPLSTTTTEVLATSSTPIQSAVSTTTPVTASSTPAQTSKKPVVETRSDVLKDEPVVVTQPLYTTPPISFEEVDTRTRASLVNILCMPKSGSLRPISGSGIIVDPRGVILTNAHVAQYVLLSESSKIDLACSIRTGAPASFTWKAEILYIPPVWVEEHAKNINASETEGTGEHDYAFLRITSLTSGEPLTTSLPYMPLDTRESTVAEDFPVLLAGYPAEFVGGITTQQNLYPVTTVGKVAQLLTFGSGTSDMFSAGGVIQAQRGASGGPAVNAWARVVGIITTTSAGKTTGERDLHIMNAEYIERDFLVQNEKTLRQFFESDIIQTAKNFRETVSPTLIAEYIRVLSQ